MEEIKKPRPRCANIRVREDVSKRVKYQGTKGIKQNEIQEIFVDVVTNSLTPDFNFESLKETCRVNEIQYFEPNKEYKVGEMFRYKGVVLETIKETPNYCEGCFLSRNVTCRGVLCLSSERLDETTVIFKQIPEPK